jgi:hypothetical protein
LNRAAVVASGLPAHSPHEPSAVEELVLLLVWVCVMVSEALLLAGASPVVVGLVAFDVLLPDGHKTQTADVTG